mgnify:CR=1 FL=1
MLEGVVTYPLLGFDDEFGEDFYPELPGPVPHVHGLLVDAAIEANTDGGGGVAGLEDHVKPGHGEGGCASELGQLNLGFEIPEDLFGGDILTRIELLGPLDEDLLDIVHDEVLSGGVDLVDEVVE